MNCVNGLDEFRRSYGAPPFVCDGKTVVYVTDRLLKSSFNKLRKFQALRKFRDDAFPPTKQAERDHKDAAFAAVVTHLQEFHPAFYNVVAQPPVYAIEIMRRYGVDKKCATVSRVNQWFAVDSCWLTEQADHDSLPPDSDEGDAGSTTEEEEDGEFSWTVSPSTKRSSPGSAPTLSPLALSDSPVPRRSRSRSPSRSRSRSRSREVDVTITPPPLVGRRRRLRSARVATSEPPAIPPPVPSPLIPYARPLTTAVSEAPSAWTASDDRAGSDTRVVVSGDARDALLAQRPVAPDLIWAFVYGAAAAFQGEQYTTVRVARPTRGGLEDLQQCEDCPPLVDEDVELALVLTFSDADRGRSDAVLYAVDAVRRIIVRCDPGGAPEADVDAGVADLAGRLDAARGWKANRMAWRMRDAFAPDSVSSCEDRGALVALSAIVLTSGSYAGDICKLSCVSSFLDTLEPNSDAHGSAARAFLAGCVGRGTFGEPVLEFPPWLGRVRREDVPARKALGDAVVAAYGNSCTPSRFCGLVDVAAAAAVPNAPPAFTRAAVGSVPDERAAVPDGLPHCYMCACEDIASLASLVFPCGRGFCAQHVSEMSSCLASLDGGEMLAHPACVPCGDAPCSGAKCGLKTEDVMACLARFPEQRGALMRAVVDAARGDAERSVGRVGLVDALMSRVVDMLVARCPADGCGMPFEPDLGESCAAACCNHCNTFFCAGCFESFPCDQSVHAHVRFCPYLDIVRPPSNGDDALFVAPSDLALVHAVRAHERVENVLSEMPGDVSAAARADARFRGAADVARTAERTRALLHPASERGSSLRRAAYLRIKGATVGITDDEAFEFAQLEVDLTDRVAWRRAYA